MRGKRKIKRNVVIVAIAVLVLIIALIAYMVIKDLKQEDILREEINTLSSIDITSGRYNTDIKTTGDYAIVEETIKDYLDEYAVTLQRVLKMMEDKTLVNMLSASNYQNDGPEFTSSKEFLAKTKEEFNKDLKTLTEMTSSETIMAKIEEKNLDSYYTNLYKELMLNGVAEEDFDASKNGLQAASDKINNILDVETQVIDLLVANNGKWSIENDKIVFQDTNTLNQYNELIQKVS